jgi:hypothetical protein
VADITIRGPQKLLSECVQHAPHYSYITIRRACIPPRKYKASDSTAPSKYSVMVLGGFLLVAHCYGVVCGRSDYKGNIYILNVVGLG